MPRRCARGRALMIVEATGEHEPGSGWSSHSCEERRRAAQLPTCRPEGDRRPPRGPSLACRGASPGTAPATLHKKEAVMAEMTRRGFLGRSLTFGVAACAMCGALPSSAQGTREIKFSHGTGLCNMPLFYAAEKKLFAKSPIQTNLVLSAWAAHPPPPLPPPHVDI